MNKSRALNIIEGVLVELEENGQISAKRHGEVMSLLSTLIAEK